MITDASAADIARRLRIATRSVEVIELCDWVLAMAGRGVTKPVTDNIPVVTNNPPIVVTRKRGRPPNPGGALSIAERAKAYRDRRKPA